MNHRTLRRTLLVAAAIASTSALPALAQYKIDNGQARDANNRIGSNGYNGAYGANTSAGGLNGNLVVTGNVGGGRAFRGALGYTDASAFRANLGTARFDNFNRDSVGIAQLRGAATPVYNNQGVTTFQPFFGGQRTVAPPAGFVQSGPTGGYVLPRPQIVSANDGRIDYGGASRQQVARSALLNDGGVIGGAGLANGSFNGFDQRQQLLQPLSEYTQLGRPTARIGLLEQNRNAFGNGLGNGLDNGVTSAPRDPNAAGNSGPESTDRQSSDAAADNRTGLNPAAGTGTSADPVRPGTTAAPADATKTGAGIQVRDLRAIQNNPQYAALRSRLDAKRPAGPGQEAIEASNRRNQQVLAQRAKQQATPDAKNADDKKPADANATPNATPSANASVPQLDGATPAPSAKDDLRLARPAATPDVTPTPEVVAPTTPVEIKSLAAGVKDAGVRKTLGEAETLMKAGKFTSAIDAYDRAQTVATDDPLVFTGRAIAELGGGYYREAEKHFRQAFGVDKSLLQARFDLRELLTAERLNFLVDDLGKVANADKTDPGPLVLLAFVYYNTNLPDRAAKALDLADQRAGGKDATAQLLRENWTLTSAGAPADGNK